MTRQVTIATILSLSFLAGFSDVARTQIISMNPDASQWHIEIHVIPKHSIRCPDEELVNLTGLALTDIYKKKFVKSSAIRSLILEDNELTYIPDTAFAEIPNLSCLNLARNRISFDEFNLTHGGLETLIFDHQRLPEPLDIYSSEDGRYVEPPMLPKLKSLSWKGFNHYGLSVPPSTFPQLESIDLSDSELHDIGNTDSMVNVLRLRTVYLERNGIRNFSMQNFGNLEALYLDGNPLEYIAFYPTNKNLRLLSLAGCSLRSVDSFYSYSLMALDLSRNSLTTLPAHAFLNTPRLERLDLSWNRLQEFPPLLHLTGLKLLSLAYNRIGRLTNVYASSSLVMLNLRGNEIDEIAPLAFQHLPELERLDLSFNRLQSLPPNWHHGMRTLRQLDLRDNHFYKINELMLESLWSLTELYVMNNRLMTIDVTTMQSLPSNCTVYVL